MGATQKQLLCKAGARTGKLLTTNIIAVQAGFTWVKGLKHSKNSLENRPACPQRQINSPNPYLLCSAGKRVGTAMGKGPIQHGIMHHTGRGAKKDLPEHLAS